MGPRKVVSPEAATLRTVSRGDHVLKTKEFDVSEGQLPDMNNIFAQAQEMQRRLLEAQEQIARTEVSGSSGGGLVTVRVTGAGELVGVAIDPRVLTNAAPPEAAEAISDLVLAAVRNANESASRLRDEAMGPLAADLGIGGPGLPGM